MKGSKKQIAWAKEIEAKYNHLVDTFGGQKIECDDASFWIEHGQVTNIGFEKLPVKLEAWNFLRTNGLTNVKVTDMVAWDAVDNGILSELAANEIYTYRVK